MPTIAAGCHYANVRPDAALVERVHVLRSRLAEPYLSQTGRTALPLSGLTVALIESVLGQPDLWRDHVEKSDRLRGWAGHRQRRALGLIAEPGFFSRLDEAARSIDGAARVGVASACLTVALAALEGDVPLASVFPDGKQAQRVAAFLDTVQNRRRGSKVAA